MSSMLASMQYLSSTNTTAALVHSNTAHLVLEQLVSVEDEMFVGRSVYHSAISSNAHEVCACLF